MRPAPLSRLVFVVVVAMVLPLTAAADPQFWITTPSNGTVVDANNYPEYLPVY